MWAIMVCNGKTYEESVPGWNFEIKVEYDVLQTQVFWACTLFLFESKCTLI